MSTLLDQSFCSHIYPFVCDEDIDHDQLLPPVMSFVRKAHQDEELACCKRSKVFLQQCYQLENFSGMSRPKMNSWIINHAIKKFKNATHCINESSESNDDELNPVLRSLDDDSRQNQTPQEVSQNLSQIQSSNFSAPTPSSNGNDLPHDFLGVFRNATLLSYHDTLLEARMQQGTGIFTVTKTRVSLCQQYEYQCKTKGCKC